MCKMEMKKINGRYWNGRFRPTLLILLVTQRVSKKNGYKLQQLELRENVKNG